MTDRPIVFISSTIRALLSDKKSQTRRLMWGEPHAAPQGVGGRPSVAFTLTDDLGRSARMYRTATIWEKVEVGDRLWVREAFAMRGPAVILYRADHSASDAMVWRPSLHLPRARSRLTLVVTEVRRERVQQISRDDAIAEGVEWDMKSRRWHFDGRLADRQDPCRVFEQFWRELHGDREWETDPEVVVLAFTVRHANIDAGE